jgi:hypothetical protein
MRYWLTLFTGKTWSEFVRAGSSVAGFPETQKNQINKITPGDRLVCYCSGISSFIGVLEVESNGYWDDQSRIWEDAPYPVRLRVKSIITLDLETSLPAQTFVHDLTFVKNLPNPKNWGVFFKLSLREWPEVDGRRLEEQLRKIQTNPVRRTLDEKLLNRKPRLKNSGSFEKIQTTPIRCWIEKSKVAGRVDRETGPYALGKALWSPQASVDGRNIYWTMKKVKSGDLVLHLVDDEQISGISQVDTEVDNNFVGLPNTEWADRPAFLVRLKNYTILNPPIPRASFLESDSQSAQLREIHKKHKHLFFNRNLRLNQGRYLTEVPLPLLQILDNIYRDESGDGLPFVQELLNQRIAINSNRYWVFQCNPLKHNFVEEMSSGPAITGWAANQHDLRIKEGDKGIVWLTGAQAGCYALVTVASDPYPVATTATYSNGMKVDLRIDLNIAHNPVLRSEIDGEPWFQDFKGGHQGTNFSLSQEAYLGFQNRAKMKDSIMNSNVHNQNTTGPLNLILQGPPGTGKTYNAVYRALQIVEPSFARQIETMNEPEKRKVAMARFNQLIDQRVIETITFHPSFSYEEFVEGIRPVKDEGDSSGGIRFECEPGILKRFVQDIQKNHSLRQIENKLISPDAEVWRMSLGERNNDRVFNDCIQHEYIGVNYGAAQNFSDLAVDSYFDQHPNQSGRSPLKQFVEQMDKGDLVCVFNTSTSIRAIGVITGQYEYASGSEMPHRRSVKWLDKGVHEVFSLNGNRYLRQRAIHALPSIRVPDILGLITKGQASKHQDTQNYVLLIDEINRGNISKIFGEVITLIEEDKRQGKANGSPIRLPYSKDSFILPANLHIIGTMNTADRSISMMDIALRRRFFFESIQPNLSLCVETVPDCRINLRELISQLNKRVRLLLGCDFEIGHSYFLSDKIKTLSEFKAVWFSQILPLLSELLYEDWDKLSFVAKPFIERTQEIHGLSPIHISKSRAYQFCSSSISDHDFAAKLARMLGESSPVVQAASTDNSGQKVA